MALEGILPVMVLIVLAEVIAEDTAVTVTDIFAFVSAGLSPTIGATPNPALNLAPFGRWTLRDKAAQRRLALR